MHQRCKFGENPFSNSQDIVITMFGTHEQRTESDART